MRNGQHKRMRGRNRKGQSPLTRIYESNGPDVKIRGSAAHVAEKYLQLARDAQASGDPIAAENYFQHAEHYLRIIAAAQEQMRQNQPFYRPDGDSEPRGELFDDSEDDGLGPQMAAEPPPYGTREPQPYLPRDAQFFPPREQSVPGSRPQPSGENLRSAERHDDEADDGVNRLPSFITGGPSQAQPGQSVSPGAEGPQAEHARSPNGFEGQGDRFPLHRRRRRHRDRAPRAEASSGMAEGSDVPQGE